MRDDVVILFAVTCTLGILAMLRWSFVRGFALICAVGLPAAIWYLWHQGELGMLERLLP